MRKEHRDMGPRYSTDWVGGIIFLSLVGCFALAIVKFAAFLSGTK